MQGIFICSVFILAALLYLLREEILCLLYRNPTRWPHSPFWPLNSHIYSALSAHNTSHRKAKPHSQAWIPLCQKTLLVLAVWYIGAWADTCPSPQLANPTFVDLRTGLLGLGPTHPIVVLSGETHRAPFPPPAPAWRQPSLCRLRFPPWLPSMRVCVFVRQRPI